MKFVKIAAACLAAVLMSACASSMAPYNPKAQPVRAANNSVGAVQVSVGAKAKEAVSDNPTFNREAMQAKVKNYLASKSMMVEGANGGKFNLEFVITDVRVRSTFVAIMFGPLAGADSIDVDLIVKSESGAELGRYAVSASFALGGFAGGQDDMRMNWLYEAIGEKTLEALTGKVAS